MRTAVFVTPVAASVGVSWLVHLALGPARGWLERGWHLALLLAVSTLALVAVDLLARRALPLVTLLELAMLFPDHAPSRLGVARDAIRRRPVEEQLERVRLAGADPSVAAHEILALVAAMRAHDRPTRGHAERVRMFTDLIAEAMRVPERDRDLLRWAAMLHDIGKLRVSPTILNKPGKPSAAEWAILRAHPAHGAEIAGALLPWLGEWGQVILQHHERFDGTGYPQGLAGREISLGGRIVAVADAYDVMTAARIYKRPVSRQAAYRELVRFSGRQFDPVVVRAMVGLSAPRLRRAQGLLAWLMDIPIVASGAVPVTAVARAVGAGALATGAATGVGVPLHVGLEPTPRPDTTTSALDRAAGDTVKSVDGSGHRAGSAAADRAAADRVRPPHPGQTPRTARTHPTRPSTPGNRDQSRAGSGNGTGTTRSPSPHAGTAGPSSGRTDAPAPNGSATGQVTKTVDKTSGPVTKTAEDEVEVVDPAVTDIPETVDDTVGTVTDTVADTLGPGD